ncbi:MAG: FKBP-type peptidyl-prolyl cis-trans isomerase [Balneolaceae bacterium]|nr:FKBP-type peptidyl-prolyl cis-trans isomerase [Balneolaceae bacterium]
MAFAIFTSCDSSSSAGGQSVELNTPIDSVSYSLGYRNGEVLRQQGMENIDLEKLLAGMRDGLNENDPQIDNRQMSTVVQNYQRQRQQQAEAQRLEESKKYREKGESFLADNRNAEGVHTTDSGLQYKVLEEGDGPSPEATDTVVVHYRGSFLDGTQFESTFERENPAQFPLNRVIKGWTEGVQLMQEGARYKFWIPADLAYGDNPRPGGPIKPGQTLVFEVELVEVK